MFPLPTVLSLSVSNPIGVAVKPMINQKESYLPGGNILSTLSGQEQLPFSRDSTPAVTTAPFGTF